MNIGEQIKQLRIARNMTQTELAKRLFITKSTVSAYENGTRLPSYDVLIKIARLFKTSTDNLLGLKRDHLIDVSGLNVKQRNDILNIVVTYQKYNLLHEWMLQERPNEPIFTQLEE